MSNRKVPIVAIGGVVYRQTAPGQIDLLLIKKQGGFWTLPKGKVEPDETPAAAVAREVFEETGITGTVEELVRQVSYRILKKGKTRRKVVTYYLFSADEGVLRPSADEHIEYVRWFPAEAALRRIRRNRVRSVVRRALPRLTQLTQSGTVHSGELSKAVGDRARVFDMGASLAT